jgi:hypothetical protein
LAVPVGWCPQPFERTQSFDILERLHGFAWDDFFSNNTQLLQPTIGMAYFFYYAPRFYPIFFIISVEINLQSNRMGSLTSNAHCLCSDWCGVWMDVLMVSVYSSLSYKAMSTQPSLYPRNFFDTHLNGSVLR